MPSGISRLLNLTNAEQAREAKEHVKHRWVNVGTHGSDSQKDTHIELMRNIGYETEANARRVGDLLLMHTPISNYERRAKEKEEMNRTALQRFRENSAMIIDREASRLPGVRPMGHDGVVDFDKKFRPRGEKVAVGTRPEEE